MELQLSEAAFEWSIDWIRIENEEKFSFPEFKLNSSLNILLRVTLNFIKKNNESYITLTLEEFKSIEKTFREADKYNVNYRIGDPSNDNIYTDILDTDIKKEFLRKFVYTEEEKQELRLEITICDKKIPKVDTYHCKKDFKALLKNEKFSDMSIIINSEKIPVHKILLARASPVFDNMFQQNVENNSIYIADFDKETVEEMLRYIYDPKNYKINDEKISQKLLCASVKFKITNLQQVCEIYLSNEHLTENNALEYLNFSIKNNAPILKSSALKELRNAKNVFKNQNFSEFLKGLPTDVVLEIISCFSNKL